MITLTKPIAFTFLLCQKSYKKDDPKMKTARFWGKELRLAYIRNCIEQHGSLMGL